MYPPIIQRNSEHDLVDEDHELLELYARCRSHPLPARCPTPTAAPTVTALRSAVDAESLVGLTVGNFEIEASEPGDKLLVRCVGCGQLRLILAANLRSTKCPRGC